MRHHSSDSRSGTRQVGKTKGRHGQRKSGRKQSRYMRVGAKKSKKSNGVSDADYAATQAAADRAAVQAEAEAAEAEAVAAEAAAAAARAAEAALLAKNEATIASDEAEYANKWWWQR
jgi:hypothetical protein